MEDRRCVEFTDVELADSAEILAPVEKAAVGHSGGEREREGWGKAHWLLLLARATAKKGQKRSGDRDAERKPRDER
jgi:hypothetical protein